MSRTSDAVNGIVMNGGKNDISFIFSDGFNHFFPVTSLSESLGKSVGLVLMSAYVVSMGKIPHYKLHDGSGMTEPERESWSKKSTRIIIDRDHPFMQLSTSSSICLRHGPKGIQT